MSEKLTQVSKTLSDREKIAAIVWLAIGIVQCCSFVFIIAGAWNIYASYTRFKQAKMVLNPWVGIVDTYDKWLTNVIISIAINLVFGGAIGVIGGIYDLVFVRAHVMSNKDVYAEAGL